MPVIFTVFRDFYSRPYARGDQISGDDIYHILNFYSRPYARGDKFTGVNTSVMKIISTHAPTRGATRKNCRFLFVTTDFYSRPYARGDVNIAKQTATFHKFLLTPLREGRLTQIDYINRRYEISTHAPTRGATDVTQLQGTTAEWIISTHAPTRGATQGIQGAVNARQGFLLTPLREGRHLKGALLCFISFNFYSRPYARGDRNIEYRCSYMLLISTHAPTRGATLCFISVSTELFSFLLTPLREGRPDKMEKNKYIEILISTHAPTRGAT